MATEIRRILFSDLEMRELVSAYINAEDGNYDPGQVIEFRQTQDDPLQMTAMIQTTAGPQRQVIFNSHDLTSVVLHHLMSKKVPVPRKADKTVTRAKNGLLALDMMIGAL